MGRWGKARQGLDYRTINKFIALRRATLLKGQKKKRKKEAFQKYVNLDA